MADQRCSTIAASRTHAVRHAHAGNLDQRGNSDITTVTVDEYLARSGWRHPRYWLYRHPVDCFACFNAIDPWYLDSSLARLTLLRRVEEDEAIVSCDPP